MPRDLAAKLKRKLVYFLFELERSIDYQKLVLRKELGGLGLVDIPRLLDITFIKPAITYIRQEGGRIK